MLSEDPGRYLYIYIPGKNSKPRLEGQSKLSQLQDNHLLITLIVSEDFGDDGDDKEEEEEKEEEAEEEGENEHESA